MAEAAANLALSMHDALLINVAARSLIDPVTDAELLGDDMEMIARLLPRVSRDGVRMCDLARACEAMLEHYPARNARATEDRPNAWARARFDGRVALAELFRWRAGQAHAQLYPVEGTV